MKYAGILGFLVGTLIVLWTFLRTFSHGASDYKPWKQRRIVWFPEDPLDAVQWDPYLSGVTLTWPIRPNGE